MPGQRIGVRLDVLFQQGDGLVRAAHVAEHPGAAHLDLRVVRDGRVGRNFERVLQPPQRRQRSDLDQRDGGVLVRLDLLGGLVQRVQRQLVAPGERLRLRLVQIVVIARVRQLLQVFRQQRVDPLLRDRVAHERVVLPRGRGPGGRRRGPQQRQQGRHYGRGTICRHALTSPSGRELGHTSLELQPRREVAPRRLL